MGSRTAQSLLRYGLAADIVPADFRGEALASELAATVAGKQVLVIRASRGSDLLPASLAQSGADVTQVTAYTNRDTRHADPKIREMANQGQIDWITTTSSASATNLARMFGDSLNQMKIASLSPVTSKTLTELGYEVAVEANPHTIESLVDAIQNRSIAK